MKQKKKRDIWESIITHDDVIWGLYKLARSFNWLQQINYLIECN